MSSKKLETADELLALFKDPEKLATYNVYVPVATKFHMEVPYEDIKAVIENMRDKILEKLPEDERDSFDWEHIGSTAIKGMPGALNPDALILLKKYPPPRSLVQALLEIGFYFGRSSVLDAHDLWFFFDYTEGFLKDHRFTIHMTTPDNRAAKILLDTRDICNSEQWAFEDYKNAKVEAARALVASKEGGWADYKKGKGSNSKLLVQLKEKYNM